MANGVVGGFLVAFFNGEGELRVYLRYALSGLVIMFFIIFVIAGANRWMRRRSFPPGMGFRGSAVILYTIGFLAVWYSPTP